MDYFKLMKERHSVRQYKETPLSEEDIQALEREIAACNEESGLHIQLVKEEEKAFSGFMAHYGKFRGVKNYIALIGPKGKDLDERCGYYGERLVLKCQELGLNTCWVALTYKKVPVAFEISAGEKLALVIALGYGETQGVAHRSKAAAAVSNVGDHSPEWFKNGVEAALLAPTAVNQQKFTLIQEGHTVRAKAGFGPYAKVDLGIVKYHFELIAGREHFKWQ